MRDREIRSQIYTPHYKWGMLDSDWIWIGLLTLGPFLVLFILDTFIYPIRIYRLPIYVFIEPLLLIGTPLFFRWSKHGRLGRWLQHVGQDFVESSTHRSMLPREVERTPWLICNQGEELPRSGARRFKSAASARAILEAERTSSI